MALTATGLTIKRAPEVLTDIANAEKANINPNINTRDDEFLGQLNQIIASSIADQQALAQAVYDSAILARAEGTNLDNLAALRGTTRIQATSTQGAQDFVGRDGTVIPPRYVISNPISGDRFRTEQQVTISTNACRTCTYSVATVLNNTEYSLTVNNQTYTFTSDADATAVEIVTGLNAAIVADTSKTFTSAVNVDKLVLTTDASTATLSASAITYLAVDQVTVRSNILAEQTGAIVAPANSVTNIITNVTGWMSTTNPAQLVVGRLQETDEELRERIPRITTSGSTGTIPSIEGALLANVAGITSVRVVENTTNVPDSDGRPSHSYETIVVGGVNDAVANEIWRTKPAGIALFGNTTVNITDSNNNIRVIRFTRPVAVNIAVRVRYTRYDEESFPSDGDATIVSTVVSHINGLGVGVDVIPGRMFGPIYRAVSGIEALTIEIQTLTNPGDPPVPGNWSTNTIEISASQFANTVSGDVTTEEI